MLLTLQMVNGVVGYYEERSAGDAIEALKKSLAPKANVKRDGAWREIAASGLVPGDRINLKLGNIVPADSVRARRARALRARRGAARMTSRGPHPSLRRCSARASRWRSTRPR